ncbi:MAG: cysteine--tRNA ligase [Candidatus Auribacterota bacterium]|jgi:cysteinyl-tRNA synthetase|nr:cysteine--tRNA ligase [Candidatus Auribacterota bacterium]
MSILTIHNTLTNKKEPFESLQQGKVGMYVCGVTVYDRCHLGHARAVVFFDVVYRYLKSLGYDVTFVRNFTDIDDKIIKRANEEGIFWKDLTEKYITKFHKDFSRLNILSPTFEPKATDHIQDIIDAVAKLIDNGFAYVVDGDVYFRVRKFEKYGSLSGRSVDELQSGARIDVNEQKEDPLDFAVWKSSKDGEPYWDSPWGHGRPGWHIECSVMSQKYLGKIFDIHGGGHDLIFPHHENEIAQSEALSGNQFVKYWIHNGFVTINKEKMSKSTGNFFALDDIFEHYEPRVLRLFLISRHYKVPLDYSTDLLDEAKQSWARVENSVGIIEDAFMQKQLDSDELDQFAFCQFMDAMNDDFNTSQALAVVFDLITAMNQSVMSNKIDIELKTKLNTVRRICTILGLEINTSDLCRVTVDDIEKLSDATDLDVYLEKIHKRDISDKDIRHLVLLRLVCRVNKDFQNADKIRAIIADMGYHVRDTKKETVFFKI